MTTLEMLSVEHALRIILEDILPLSSEKVGLNDSVGRILAQDVVAAENMPPFANSSMDGYALRAADISRASSNEPVTLEVIADISAGQVSTRELTSGTAARIMTGAPVPAGADSVVPVEDTSEPWRGAERKLPKSIDIRTASNPGAFIRYPGEDIEIGDVVLKSGQAIRPQEVGVLASLGISKVEVFRRPRIAILATGDELIDVEAPLEPGKIRNSNGFTQAAQVRQLGAVAIDLGVARDSMADVQSKLDTGIDSDIDLFISSAGVSVGAHDVVKSVLEEHGQIKIWRVRMRPGKPLVYALYKNKPYLGLPGNPVSAMVVFEKFARPCILKMAGHTRLSRPHVTVIVEEDIKSDGRESYIRANVYGESGSYRAVTTGRQGSHMLTSLVRANGLLVVPEGVTSVRAGEQLNVLMLDWPEVFF